MAKHSCLNVTSDGQNYSSPMPVIGLYIVAATLVCFLCILCDVLHGLRHGKPWLPCRFFSLNSLTLSLLAIASKFPVDLTTSMPSALDQLSKLSGTTVICISMGFLIPSLGTQSESERLLNIGSLSILVVTVVVNVCIQMATGVIFTFIVEHAIILSCMVLLLMVLWSSVLEVACRFEGINDKIKEDDINNAVKTSMMETLKSVYRSCYPLNPQFLFSGSPHSITMGMLSTLSSLVLLQAIFRSLVLKDLKFPCGISDYKWSMLIIVVTQILTILLGAIAITYRWFTSVSHFEHEFFPTIFCPTEVDNGGYSLAKYLTKLKILSFFEFSEVDLLNMFKNMVQYVLIALQEGISIMVQLATCLPMEVRICYSRVMTKPHSRTIWWTNQKTIVAEWMKKKTEDDLNRWVEKYKRDSPTNLIRLLSNTNITSSPPFIDDREISLLSLVILARMAIISLPDTFSAPIIHALDEAFEIICFIDKKMNATNFYSNMICFMSKDMWMKKNTTNHCFPKKISINGEFQSQAEMVDRAHGIDEELFGGILLDQSSNNILQALAIEGEIHYLYHIIFERERQPDASLIDLHDFIMQLFVYMLKFFLLKLPQAIFKHVDESPFEECEEQARLGIRYLCKLEPLVDILDWSFPENTGITKLIEPVEATDVVVQVIKDGEIQEHA